MKPLYFFILLLTALFFIGIQTSYSAVKKNIADELDITESFFSIFKNNVRYCRNAEYDRPLHSYHRLGHLSSKQAKTNLFHLRDHLNGLNICNAGNGPLSRTV